MKKLDFKQFSQRGALVMTVCAGIALPTFWLAGCSGGSGGTGISLGSGLPTGGGGGGPSGGGGGGGGTVATPTPIPACGGGTLTASFTAATATNAGTATFNATQVRGTVLGGSTFTITGTLCNPPASGNRTVTIKVNQALVAGRTYLLSTGSAGNNYLQYLESTASEDGTVEKSWTATSARLVIQSVTGQNVTFRIENAAMAADPDFFTSNAIGTFNLSVAGSTTVFSGL